MKKEEVVGVKSVLHTNRLPVAPLPLPLPRRRRSWTVGSFCLRWTLDIKKKEEEELFSVLYYFIFPLNKKRNTNHLLKEEKRTPER